MGGGRGASSIAKGGRHPQNGSLGGRDGGELVEAGRGLTVDAICVARISYDYNGRIQLSELLDLLGK